MECSDVWALVVFLLLSWRYFFFALFGHSKKKTNSYTQLGTTVQGCTPNTGEIEAGRPTISRLDWILRKDLAQHQKENKDKQTNLHVISAFYLANLLGSLSSQRQDYRGAAGARSLLVYRLTLTRKDKHTTTKCGKREGQTKQGSRKTFHYLILQIIKILESYKSWQSNVKFYQKTLSSRVHLQLTMWNGTFGTWLHLCCHISDTNKYDNFDLNRLSMVICIWNPSIQRGKAGGSFWVQRHLGLHSNIFF